MQRVKIALALLASVLATLSLPAVAAPTATVDQAAWTSLKQEVQLPNGIRLAYVEGGDPRGEPLLLLHGYTDTSRSWSLLTPGLARFRLLIPDQRGHGASDAPQCCYSSGQLADDARLFLDALGVEKAAVAGHSMGSMAAIALAAEHPRRVSKLVLIGSTGLAPLQRGDWMWDNIMGMTFPIDRSSQFMQAWDPTNQPTPVDAAFAAAVREDYYVIPRHVWRGVIREVTAVPIARHAADVRAPVLILSADKDPLFGPEHHAALVKAFPGASARMFQGLGHNFHWEQPREVAAAIDDFLQPQPR